MSETSALLTRVSEEEGIAWLTLNRPERKNALSKALMAEIIECLKELRENDNIRCIVTTGAGDSFCSGLDLYDLRESWKRKRRWEEGGTAREIITILRSCPQVTIAAINGYCLGGGLVLLNGHDIRFAADNARIGMPEVIRGSYGAIATPTLFQSGIPTKKAFYIHTWESSMTPSCWLSLILLTEAEESIRDGPLNIDPVRRRSTSFLKTIQENASQSLP